jgi:hypothetical protein
MLGPPGSPGGPLASISPDHAPVRGLQGATSERTYDPPRPQGVIAFGAKQSATTYPALGLTRPRWSSRSSILIITAASKAVRSVRFSRCRSTVRPSVSHLPQTSCRVRPRGGPGFLCRHQVLAPIRLARGEHRPHDASQLVRQCYDNCVPMGALREVLQPSAKRGGRLGETQHHRPGPMD